VARLEEALPQFRMQDRDWDQDRKRERERVRERVQVRERVWEWDRDQDWVDRVDQHRVRMDRVDRVDQHWMGPHSKVGGNRTHKVGEDRDRHKVGGDRDRHKVEGDRDRHKVTVGSNQRVGAGLRDGGHPFRLEGPEGLEGLEGLEGRYGILGEAHPAPLEEAHLARLGGHRAPSGLEMVDLGEGRGQELASLCTTS
jgi:hypothetical protein